MDNQTDSKHFIVCLAFCIERSCQVRARAAQLLWVSQQNTRSSVPVSRYIVEALLMLECSSERMKHDEFKWKTMSMYIDYVNQFFTSTIKHWPLELPQVFLASFLYFCVIPISVSFASLLPFSYAYVGRLAAGRTKAIECVCALTKRAARCDPCHHISYHLVQCCRWSCLIYWCWAAAGL